MADIMTFPETVEEFMNEYKVVDKDGVYMSKGSELVPIFRMRQWFERPAPADVRPVVFCRDCFANGLCSVQDLLFYNDVDKAEDFFCANGRREEDG